MTLPTWWRRDPRDSWPPRRRGGAGRQRGLQLHRAQRPRLWAQARAGQVLAGGGEGVPANPGVNSVGMYGQDPQAVTSGYLAMCLHRLRCHESGRRDWFYQVAGKGGERGGVSEGVSCRQFVGNVQWNFQL